MAFLARLISWLNAVGNALFGLLDKPMAALPAWLSLTIISAVLGALMLLLFKYTSNQTAIGRVRDTIKFHLLAMKLFKDNPKVILKTPWQIIAQAFLLLFHAIRPMLIMALPFALIMGQMGLWYQFRPMAVGEQTLVTVQLADSDANPMPQVTLAPSPIHEVLVGPVRVPSKHQVFWQIQAAESGHHILAFQVADQQVQKQLAVGDDLMPVSADRPGLDVMDLILHPAEKPFDESSPVQSISIGYPGRFSELFGAGLWVWGVLVIAIAAGFACKPFFNVKF